MPGWAGYTMADEILNFYYRGTAIPIGANLYLRLLVAASNRAGGGTETTYAGYSRYTLSRGATIFAPSANGYMDNIIALAFPVATSLGNGDFVAFDVVDTPSGAFNNLFNGGPVLPAKAVVVGKAPTFAIGALQFTF